MFKTAWRLTLRLEGALRPHLRYALDVRDARERRRRHRRVGDAAPPSRRCEGLQEVLADEVADETRVPDRLNSTSNESARVFGQAG
jgi:hypothetical protein